MSTWVDRINDHPIFKTLTKLNQSLEESKSKAEAASIEAVEALDRISNGSRFIEGLLNRVEPILIVPTWLDQINSSLTQISACVTQFGTASDIGQLNSGNAHLDTALSQISTIHVLATPTDIDNLREASATFRRACGQLSRNLEADVEQTRSASVTLKAKLDELTTEITTQKKRLDDAITGFTESFNTAQSARNEEFSTTKEKLKSDISSVIAKSQESVSALISEGKEAINQLQKNLQENHDAHLKSTIEKSEGLVENIGKHQDEAERLVGIISMTGIVGGYQQVADKERDSFVRWRIGTVLCMILLASFGFYTFYTAVSPNFEPAAFANRLFVTVTLALLAGYSAFQADRHRKSEIENRRMELELASFDPFLASLTDEERNELKKVMADRIFGRNAIHTNENEPVSPGSIVDLLKLAVESLAKSKN